MKNTRTEGPAPRRAGTTRGGIPEALRTFLGHRLSGWFAALTFLAFFLPSTALAQAPAPTPPQQGTFTVPPDFVQRLQQSLQNDPDPVTPTPSENCVAPEGFTCITLLDTIRVGVPAAIPIANTATQVQEAYVSRESFQVYRRHMSDLIHDYRRRLQRDEQVLAQQGQQIRVIGAETRAMIGCGPDTPDQACFEGAVNFHRYWAEVLPAQNAAWRAMVDETDAAQQAAISQEAADIRDVNARFTQLEGRVTQLETRTTAVEQVNTQQTADIHAMQQGRERQWIGPQTGVLSTSCPSDHNCWTGVTVGFGYAGRPIADSPFGASGGIDLGYLWGRSGAYSSFLIRARGAIGWQSMSNTFGLGFGGQFMALLTAQTDGGAAFIGGGPVATAWWKPTSWLRLIGEVGGMFGTIRVAGTAEATGHGEDHSAFTFGGFAEIPISGF